MSSKTKKAIVVSICIAAVAAAFLLFRKASPLSLLAKAGAADAEIMISPRSMTFWVDATGLLRATSVQNYGGPPAVRNYWNFQIVSMAPEGKNVKKDEMLIMFDAARVRDDLQRFQNELDQATKELEKTKVQIDLERQDLTARLAAAENNFEKLKLKQAKVEGIEAVNDIERDRLALEQARREVEALKSKIEWHRQSSDAAYKVIVSKKTRAENKVSEIQKGMERFQAKADRDGVVVYKTKWNGERFQVGEQVWSGQPIMEIPDLNTILAEAFVPEVDIGKVKTGQRAEVTIDAFPGRTFYGTVKNIGTLVRPKAWDIPNKVLEAQVALDNLDTSIMRPAMSIKVKIEIASISDCLAVPLKAVLITADGALVKVKTETGWREQRVTLGESNGIDIVITEGIKAGDRVAADFSKAK
ncbi:MAG TPA: efflux RND transporter periplasmic adaptor subunit [Blastocatellia bacterium]|nr:efflux RND transporter periplasmic adaptor subunit [Blastocatellia bacterium]